MKFLTFLLSGSVILASDDADLNRPIDASQKQVKSSASYANCGVANANASGKIYGGKKYNPKKYVHFFTDNIVQKPRSGQICHLFSRTLLSSKIVDIYIHFSKTEKKLKRKRSLKLFISYKTRPPLL